MKSTNYQSKISHSEDSLIPLFMSKLLHSISGPFLFPKKKESMKEKKDTFEDRNRYINFRLNIESFYSQFQLIGNEKG